MSEPKLHPGTVGQALYTWSNSTIAGSSGVGFVEISPALSGSIEWLRRLQPQAFRVHLETSLVPYDHTEQKFSYVGRICRNGCQIVFCKTDRAHRDDKGRDHSLVHALFSVDPGFDLSSVVRIPSSVWITGSAGHNWPSLSDMTGKEVGMFRSGEHRVTPTDPDHDCDHDDHRAKAILQEFADSTRDSKRAAVLTTWYPELNYDLLRIIPESLWSYAELEHFREQGEVTARITISVPIVGSNRVDVERSPQCQLKQSVRRAESRLYQPNGGMRAFAQAALGMEKKSADGAPKEVARTIEFGPLTPEELSGRISELLNAGGGVGDRLTEASASSVAAQIRGAGGDVAATILEADQEALTVLLATTVGSHEVSRWASYLADLTVEDLLELWRRSRIGLFLGLLLLRQPEERSLRQGVLASSGVEPRATAQIMLWLATRPEAADHFAVLFRNGLAETENSRQFLARTLAARSQFLFDAVLPKAELSRECHLDFIRFAFKEWALLRGLSGPDADSIEVLLRPGLMERLRVLLPGGGVRGKNL
jgi:hypothetical protein